jgi:hypothetical protein
MRKDKAEKWAEALESGRFIQGFGQLKQRDKINDVVQHCVLGVIVELWDIEHGEHNWSGDSDNSAYECDIVKAYEFNDWPPLFQILEDGPDYPRKTTATAVYANDAARISFEEFATLIRQQAEQL